MAAILCRLQCDIFMSWLLASRPQATTSQWVITITTISITEKLATGVDRQGPIIVETISISMAF